MLKDCSKALALNARSSKAFYRSSMALLALERFVECLDCCDRCLQYDTKNESIAVLRQKAARSMDARDRKIRMKQENALRELEEKRRLHTECRVRHIHPAVPPTADRRSAPKSYSPERSGWEHRDSLHTSLRSRGAERERCHFPCCLSLSSICHIRYHPEIRGRYAVLCTYHEHVSTTSRPSRMGQGK